MIIFLYRFRFHTGIGVMIALLWEQLSFSTRYMPDRMGLWVGPTGPIAALGPLLHP